jgi:putative copper resistance protein D
MTEGELTRGIARGLHLAGSLSIFGAALFRAVIAPPVLDLVDAAGVRLVNRSIAHVVRSSLLVALIAGVFWLLLEAVYIGGSSNLEAVFGFVWPVLRETNFGRLLVLRCGLIVLAVLVFGDGAGQRRMGIAALLAGAAAATESALDHGAAMPGSLGIFLWGSTAIHIVAAGAWLGALMPLYCVVDAVPPAAAQDALRRFSPLGVLCVSAIALTALVQGVVLVGGFNGLLFTNYGQVVLVKILLFCLLLCLAGINRYCLTPRLTGLDAAMTQQHLRISIAVEIATGLAVLLAAGILMNLMPGMDRQSMRSG